MASVIQNLQGCESRLELSKSQLENEVKALKKEVKQANFRVVSLRRLLERSQARNTKLEEMLSDVFKELEELASRVIAGASPSANSE
jgi:predicted  nucleic acid-binding Zn-ribbon protein